jgi:hypothetical protein
VNAVSSKGVVLVGALCLKIPPAGRPGRYASVLTQSANDLGADQSIARKLCPDFPVWNADGGLHATGLLGLRVDASRETAMLITRLKLKNWRNFRALDVSLRETTYVLGPNAAESRTCLTLSVSFTT